ncbi:sigma-70 family RNA polymerase sigma factor [Geodermatophilus sp. SYSU D00710]
MTCPTATLATPLTSAVSSSIRAAEGNSDGCALAVAARDARDDRELADFDLPALIDDLDLSNVPSALAQLEAIRAPYTCAARREGRLLAADFSDEVTALLSGRRAVLQAVVQAPPSGAASGAGGGRRAQRDVEALNELAVRVNAGRVDDVVRRFAPPMAPVDLEDVRAAAAEALVRSVTTFDPARGRFGQWAFKSMHGAVLNAVRALRYPMLSWSEFLSRPAVLAAREALSGPGRQEPSVADIAAACGAGVPLGQVARVLRPAQLRSLESSVGDDGRHLGDVLVDKGTSVEDAVVHALVGASVIDSWLVELDAREHFVIVRRFGLDGEPEQSLASIGRQLNLTRETVRQIERKALDRLLVVIRGMWAPRPSSR